MYYVWNYTNSRRHSEEEEGGVNMQLVYTLVYNYLGNVLRYIYTCVPVSEVLV